MRLFGLMYPYYLLTRDKVSDEVKAWEAKLTELGYGKPSSGFLNALSTLLSAGLESGTVFSRMKTGNLYGFGSIEAGTINFKDPNSYQHTSPDLSSVVYEAGMGVKSVGSGNSYLNTNYKVNEYSGIETDLTTVVYVSESSEDVGSTTVVGSRSLAGGLTTQYALRPYTTEGFGQRLGYAAIDAFANPNHKGLYVMTYDGANAVIYKDGVKDSQAVTPTAPDLSNPVFFLARNGNSAGGTSPSEYYTKYTAGLFRFDRFSDADESLFRAAFSTFKNAVGLP